MANAGAAAAPLAQLDRAQVREELSLLAILLPPKQIAAALKSIKKLLLNRTRQQNVVDAPKGSSEAGKSPGKLLLLSEIISEKYMSEGESVELLPEECRAVLAGEGCELVKHKMVLEYEHFTYEEALRKVLPSEVEVPGSFETIGHVAHLNLREGHEHFRLVIAQVMIDKFPAIKTVVNKMGTITNTFRVFAMEVLADRLGGTLPRVAQPGDAALETSVRQNGSIFSMNFGELYWNSRLEAEHSRLVSTFTGKDEVWDMFAGIGPFAVPAAKSHFCRVYANDLNPRSVHYLDENCRLNKVTDLVTTSCSCAREFLRGRVSACGDTVAAAGGRVHCIMNLPQDAPEFLDCFRGAFRPDVWKPQELPMVHLYAFAKSADPDECTQDIARRAVAALGCEIPGLTSHTVRDVAPRKLMMCLSFPLPPEAAFASIPAGDGVEQRDAKRAKA